MSNSIEKFLKMQPPALTLEPTDIRDTVFAAVTGFEQWCTDNDYYYNSSYDLWVIDGEYMSLAAGVDAFLRRVFEMQGARK